MTNLVVLPVGLGLLGFVEPCSIASTLLFVKSLEGKDPARKLAQVTVFAATRALFVGLLGMLAVVFGAAFFGFQRAAWFTLGNVYIALGLLYLSGRVGVLMVSLGPRLLQLSQTRGAAALGLLFGLNIPACAAPLIFALLATAAAGATSSTTLASGFIALSLFGFALSLLLLLAVMFEPARRALDWVAGLSGRIPIWTGAVFILLGAWSIWLALMGTPKAEGM